MFEAVFGTNLFIMWNGCKAAVFSGTETVAVDGQILLFLHLLI